MAQLSDRIRAIHGDSREVLKTLAGESVDSCVCDPPYALVSIIKRFGKASESDNTRTSERTRNREDGYARLVGGGFMGQKWDTGETAHDPEFWREVYRVLKPGAHVVAFGGTRTFHRLAAAIEDAGFETRDTIFWCFGAGFPKSHNIGGGWGTALKPAAEPLCVAQKPHVLQREYDTIGSQLSELLSCLWSMLPANIAERNFGLSGPAFNVACASARWSADERRNTRDGLCELMGTSRFVLALTSSLSTVSSWQSTWAAGSRPENTSTIETVTSATIGLRTLSCLLSQITPASITQAHSSGLWSVANASNAERIFSATVNQLSATLELSALAPAISQEAHDSPVAGAKPSLSLATLARKPIVGTVAANVQQYGTGAINVDGCRVGTEQRHNPSAHRNEIYGQFQGAETNGRDSVGRWPANIIHDGSEEVVGAFPHTESGDFSGHRNEPKTNGVYGKFALQDERGHVGDAGSAARFFYSSKADSDDRLGSKHPTVKPIDLMQYLIRLVCPRGGLVLDPFAGTGTTGEAAWREGCRALLIEREAQYFADIQRRLKLMQCGPDERARESIKASGKVMAAGPLFAPARTADSERA